MTPGFFTLLVGLASRITHFFDKEVHILRIEKGIVDLFLVFSLFITLSCINVFMKNDADISQQSTC